MTPQVARPLPECPGCGDPVRRDVYMANGGRCTDCRLRADFSAQPQLDLGLLDAVEDQ